MQQQQQQQKRNKLMTGRPIGKRFEEEETVDVIGYVLCVCAFDSCYNNAAQPKNHSFLRWL